MPERHAKLYIGIDVGGTKILASLIEGDSWRILTSTQVETNASAGKETVLRNIEKAAHSLLINKPVAAIGIGFAGLTDVQKGLIVKAPNFPKDLENLRLTDILSKRLKKPVFLDNDVHCFALAEAVKGVGKGKESVFGITLGTGIGGALVINGRLYRGRNNAAGEVGHTTIAMGSDARCGCGKSGHFESLASGSSLKRLYFKQTKLSYSGEEIVSLASRGDKNALKVMKTVVQGLAVGLGNIAYTYNPDVIVIGGGLAKVTALWKLAAKLAEKNLVFPKLAPLPIHVSKLGHRANVIGAAILAAENR